MNAPSNPRRFRFGLRTLLAIILIASLAVAQFAAIRHARKIEALNRALSGENSKLRAEAGYLAVSDQSKISAVQILTLDEACVVEMRANHSNCWR